MSYHDDIMKIMSDGRPRTATEVARELYPDLGGYEFRIKVIKIKPRMDKAVKFKFLVKIGSRGGAGGYAAHIYVIVDP